MGIQHPAQFVDFGLGHALGGQAAGHALQRLANLVELDQLGMAEGNHPRPDMGHPHQQPLPFQAMDRLAQGATADAVGTRQLGLGDLAAGSDLAAHYGGLDSPEDVFGERFRVQLFADGAFSDFQHDCQHISLWWRKNYCLEGHLVKQQSTDCRQSAKTKISKKGGALALSAPYASVAAEKPRARMRAASASLGASDTPARLPDQAPQP
ncbi:hypothetical protein D9M70_413480 [compost metagenome]